MHNLPLQLGAIMRRQGFSPGVVIIAFAIVVLFGGGAVVAWKTSYLDYYLPQAVKEFFGKSQTNNNGAPTASDTSEPSSQDSEPNAEDSTKDWKTYTNNELGFSFKYPGDWKQGDYLYDTAGGIISIVSKNGEIGLSLHKDFQGGREEPIRFEEKYYKLSDGSEAYTTVYYGLDGDEQSAIVDGTFYPQLPGITFIFGFDLRFNSNGLETLSLILSTLKIL